MKKAILITAILSAQLLANSGICRAQRNGNDGPFIYGELGGGWGNFGSYHCAITGIFAKDNMISIGYTYNVRKTPELPSDFKSAYWSFGGADPDPQQRLSMFALMYGKVFYTRSPNVRFVARGGLSAGNAFYSSDFTSAAVITTTGLFGDNHTSNYSWTDQQKPVIGLLLNPSVELPISRIFGFSLGLYANINPVASAFTFDANIILGKLRNKKIAKK